MPGKNPKTTQSPSQEGPPEKTAAQELVLVSEVLPDRIPIMPIYPRPVFPHFMLPLTFSGEKFLEIIHDAIEKHNGLLGLVLISGLNEQSYIDSTLHSSRHDRPDISLQPGSRGKRTDCGAGPAAF